MSTVFVGLSGGVDSAVSAALLKEQGHTVVGCFIKIWQPEFIECTWREDRLDALRVCTALKIPFRELDLSDAYKREVIDEMVSWYARGITPNPDVLCNRKIKFGLFSEWAFTEGADFIATGHYARTKDAPSLGLMRGLDIDKDQSYFLWQLTQKDLSRIRFPIGHLTKREVRVEAERRNIPNAKKPDSQGLCFVGDISLPEFLSHYITFTKGAVLNMDGHHVGEHDGAALYTRGQRHGFTHSGKVASYVVSTNISNNTITISSNAPDLTASQVTLTHVNWIQEVSLPFTSNIQVRYREQPSCAQTLEMGGNTVAVFLERRVAAPGQSLVWYDGDNVIGGGYIESTV